MYYKKTGDKTAILFSPMPAMAVRTWIIERVIQLHVPLSMVLGIFLSGTRAGLPRDQYSDLDFIVVYQGQEPPRSMLERIRWGLGATPEEIHTDYDVSSEYGISTSFDISHVETCLVYYEHAFLKKAIKSFYEGNFKKIGVFYPGATVAAIAENPILLANGDALHKLKAAAANFPEEAKPIFCRYELGWFEYYLYKVEQFVYRRDWNGLQLTFVHAVDSILNVIFTINGIPYSGPGKAFEAKIDRLRIRPQNLVDEISIIYSGYDKHGDTADIRTRSCCLSRLQADTRVLVEGLFGSLQPISSQ